MVVQSQNRQDANGQRIQGVEMRGTEPETSWVHLLGAWRGDKRLSGRKASVSRVKCEDRIEELQVWEDEDSVTAGRLEWGSQGQLRATSRVLGGRRAARRDSRRLVRLCGWWVLF